MLPLDLPVLASVLYRVKFDRQGKLIDFKQVIFTTNVTHPEHNYEMLNRNVLTNQWQIMLVPKWTDSLVCFYTGNSLK